MVWGPDWEFSQDTGVNTPTISAMGSLMTSESQDTHLTSHPKDGTLHRAVFPITALRNREFFLDQRKECLLLALQHHFQQHLVSHPGTDLDQPCLASEASQQWYAGWYAAGKSHSWITASLCPSTAFKAMKEIWTFIIWLNYPFNHDFTSLCGIGCVDLFSVCHNNGP